eukprot:gene10736-22430_t
MAHLAAAARQPVKSTKKDDKNKNKGMTEYILGHSISCGYLLQFCNSEHNAENLNFAMEIDKFKDKHQDPTCWKKTWLILDAELNIKNLAKDLKTKGDCLDGHSAEWPSRNVQRESISFDIQTIWDQFLSNDSSTQICLSLECLRRTQFRINNLHAYGTEVFGEALIDPIKTINRDILPRFMKSTIYRNLNVRLAHVDPLPLAATLEVAAPANSFLDDDAFMANADSHSYTLDEILNDKYLYEAFLDYLKAQFCPENLLCVRMIQIFEDLLAEKNIIGANDQSWEIYKYFIAPGSAFEVSCHSRVRKDIMLSLSKNAPGDFDKVRKAAYTMLTANFASFQSTSNYTELTAYLRKTKREIARRAAAAEGIFAKIFKKWPKLLFVGLRTL